MIKNKNFICNEIKDNLYNNLITLSRIINR